MEFSTSTARTNNIYPEQWQELGFVMTPTNILIMQTEDERTHFDPEVVQGCIFQDDGMIQIVIPDDQVFTLCGDGEQNISLMFKDGKLISEFGDAPEPTDKDLSYRVYLFLVPDRNDGAYGREHPKLREYITQTTITEEIPKKLKEIRDRIAEDYQLGKLADSRSDQKRIRVDIDKL